MTEPISYWDEIKRKLIHLSSFWIVAMLIFLPRFINHGRWFANAILVLCLIFTLVSEHDYANGGKYLGKLYGKLFRNMLRSEVSPGQWIVSGGAPVLAAALLMNLLFPPMIAASALAVMLAGDAFAALIGRKFGKHPLVNGKSLEGTISFIIAGYIALAAVGLLCGATAKFYIFGIIGTVLGSIAELFTKQLKIDDNFTIPLTVSLVLCLTLL